jgi:hypothetical protein
MTPPVTDDPTISDDARLWRRIPRWHFVFDENLRRWRPSSAAFADSDEGGSMSVGLAGLVSEAGREAASVLSGLEGYGLAEITAGLVRRCGQSVVRDPLPEEPAHALVVGNKTRAVQRKLAREAIWVVPPPDAA